MAKFQSPLLGYNNNVRHRGRVFHIQTEDSGVNHPHVITHLFMDGGRILKSVKKSYAEHVGSDGMNETVRVLMKEQHKAMFIALRDGQFDELVEGAGAKKGSDPKAPKVVPPAPASETKPTDATADANAATAATAEVVPPPAPSHVEIAAVAEEPAPNTIDESRRPSMPAEPFALEANGPNTVPERAVASAPPPEMRRPSAAELTLDFDALERDSAVGVNPLFQPNDLPPPPKNLFAKERGTGTYSTVEPHHDDTRAPARPSARPSTRPSALPPRKTLPPSRKDDRREDSGRYAPARPANIFGSTLKPQSPAAPSIFGDDLVSDKSLDEVILSYLAEDLDPKR
ncbi:MAG: hypothetical protein KIT84_42810 [Labilithrix sp.]|nr:hypothetical protein [Labilithrix sp.]MCW5817810.1 hypothetical protein [Labilithrix sp.]